MARYMDAKCRLCRREGEKLFLKGSKCYSDKCAVERRPFAPGMHGQGRRPGRASDYGMQLREKQKVKRIYGLQEKQFRKYFQDADRMPGVTGLNLLHLLESRLDNIVFRMGLASSRTEARQIVRHKHILVDGGVVNIPSARVSVGARVALAKKAAEHLRINAAAESAGQKGIAEWLDVDLQAKQGSFRELPARDQLDSSIREQLIVELYSK
ncbi:MAG: 30S ribosomal protein S4 [Zetaproteobacteria bacterium CG06_land_8_20_14_3_00_59_53]|nr:MAG: 30S ribosomal protein S4 [Zetaproteobacteria bacterium CG2_30_59_37]PIO90360.1 MAG: 30S ribosomal protein S4 [Zetaproteobacteria bacterium CG23_combo_of_CG06-09_8_20_14_all_59_86]PIQ65073.1 MAG: 30S ribosomal protein S4 [Zetaproteobacteria bacterium CG11_big_fil_rev_8_21_14_0_20_59_439]PIU70174.1 MAG: 30S ribosomal protein S4 [Zetaproteobacteria bacterium CG06_land_8_20_14_3_00_59_53]PIU96145.1 MAG: 30S ribosomal protein S4 [Zetaproteobacteria bacterium CG03_land_8_20_14_0_80_59_51]PIY